jgi:hypothetical protein
MKFMKFMKKIIFAAMMTMGLLSIWSCNKNEDILQKTENNILKEPLAVDEVPIPEIRNNRLYFNSQEAVNLFVGKLANCENISKYNTILKDKGFISYFQLSQMEKSDFDKVNIENKSFNDLPDDVLRTVLNVNQEIQIANVICRLESDFGFIYEEKDKALINNFKSDKPEFEDMIGYKERVLVFKINKKINTYNTENIQKIWIAGYGWHANWSDPVLYSTSPKRQVIGHQWQTNLLFYQNVGVATYNEEWKKTGWWLFASWGWTRSPAELLTLTLNGKATVVYPQHTMPITYNHTKEERNTSEVIHHFLPPFFQVSFSNGRLTLPILGITLPFGVGSPNQAPISANVDELITSHSANRTYYTKNLKWW